MKIAIFSDTFPPQINGVANVAHATAKALAENGHEVHVFTVSLELGTKEESPDKRFSLVRLPALPAIAYPEQRFALPLGLAVAKLAQIRPDIIHVHTPFSVGWEAVLASKIFSIPIVGTHHTFFDHYLKHVMLDYDWAKKISWKYVVGFYNLCDLVLSPSRSLAAGFENNGLRKPLRTLPNSIDTKLFRPAEKNFKKSLRILGPTLVYMGRLSYEKSVDQVLEATAEVMKKVPAAKLVILGDGPERKNLEKLASDLGIEKNVLWLGFRRGEDLAGALRASDIFLSASRSENMPLSVLEAMASGLPVVVPDALGMPEIVEDRLNGFLFEPGNPADMAEKILSLLRDEKLLDKFGEAGRKLALNYSEENAAKSLEEIYRAAILQK